MKTPDTRDWSLSKRTLYELHQHQSQKSKKRRHRIEYWVVVSINHKNYGYQLSKDIQKAIRHDTIENARKYLIGSLIVIPISNYKNGQAQMTVGKIIWLYQRPHTSNSRWITRGQFIKINPKDHSQKQLDQTYNYLKHDYDQESQMRIKQAINNILTPQPNPTTANVVTAIFAVSGWILIIGYIFAKLFHIYLLVI